MCNYLIFLKFCGTKYHGFQVQKNAISVCQVFQDALERIFGFRPDVKGCSRTDTGVHAIGYALSVKIETNIEPNRLVYALNQQLPSDIAAVRCLEVPPDFHARYNSVGKEYLYKVLNSRIKDPFSPNLTYRLPYILDVELLDKEAKHFVGQHDFAAFSSAGRKEGETMRNIYHFSVEKLEDTLCFRVWGDGFLYNQVRIMVGTLLQIATGDIERNSIPAILQGKNRQKAGKTAPAHGLYLSRVFYEDIEDARPPWAIDDYQ